MDTFLVIRCSIRAVANILLKGLPRSVGTEIKEIQR